jgi:hypothetical protein
MPGTFQIDSTKVGQTIDPGPCVLQSMKLVSAPSGPLPPWAPDPVSGLPAGGRTMCLATTVGGKLVQFYNFDCWANSQIPGVVVPITPQPPPATPLADLYCTSCPDGFVMEIVTV